MEKMILICLLVLILVSGCKPSEITYSEPPQQPVQKQPTETIEEPEIQEPKEETKPIQTLGDIYISTENWDADAEIDGLEFDLAPRDVNDNIVPTDGTVNAKMWEYRCVDKDIILDMVYCKKEDCGNNEPTETWSIDIKKDSFGWSGATVRLEYKKYQITDDENKKGCMEIVLETPDGKKFTVKEDTIFINGLF